MKDSFSRRKAVCDGRRDRTEPGVCSLSLQRGEEVNGSGGVWKTCDKEG